MLLEVRLRIGDRLDQFVGPRHVDRRWHPVPTVLQSRPLPQRVFGPLRTNPLALASYLCWRRCVFLAGHDVFLRQVMKERVEGREAR